MSTTTSTTGSISVALSGSTTTTPNQVVVREDIYKDTTLVGTTYRNINFTSTFVAPTLAIRSLNQILGGTNGSAGPQGLPYTTVLYNTTRGGVSGLRATYRNVHHPYPPAKNTPSTLALLRRETTEEPLLINFIYHASPLYTVAPVITLFIEAGNTRGITTNFDMTFFSLDPSFSVVQTVTPSTTQVVFTLPYIPVTQFTNIMANIFCDVPQNQLYTLGTQAKGLRVASVSCPLAANYTGIVMTSAQDAYGGAGTSTWDGVGATDLINNDEYAFDIPWPSSGLFLPRLIWQGNIAFKNPATGLYDFVLSGADYAQGWVSSRAIPLSYMTAGSTSRRIWIRRNPGNQAKLIGFARWIQP